MSALRMTRSDSAQYVPDARRVILKPFVPSDEIYADGSSRMAIFLDRILAMSDDEIDATLAIAGDEFAHRHRDLDGVLDANFDLVSGRLGRTHASVSSLPLRRRRVIGAYFTHEYSIEAAALGNPSMVIGPDQTGLADGEARFVMSLRAIGEGHRSSIEFRTGVIAADATVRVDTPNGLAQSGDRRPHFYDKRFFTLKLDDLELRDDVAAQVLARLDDRFSMTDLEGAIAAITSDDGVERSLSGETTRVLHWLASSNYRTSFPPTTDVSERVLFPSGPTESNGMEDARFVRFVDEDGAGDGDGAVRYLATYTAFDGHQILPQLIETVDFVDFRIATLTGTVAHNKGIALFPRRIGGSYVALGRHDNVNNYVMTSSDVRVWRDATVIQEPERPWELMQLGNCGSPLETDAGWLVITHGVGPFRRYALGALLLDLDDPTRVLGHLKEPLLSPTDAERDGYVPNVVYSCGGVIHADHLVLPYGYADVGASIATIRLEDLLERLTSPAR